MEFTCISFFAVVFMITGTSSFTFEDDAKRHYIYWKKGITAIITEPARSLQVEMGQFLDIVCPLTNLGITEDPEPPAPFHLYNVTEEGFKNCDPTGGRAIFDCSLPEQENKLTIKFQSISPSPFGFRFQECAEYYFLAVKTSPDGSHSKPGCSEDTERLRIRVGCSHEKEEKRVEPPTTTSTDKPKTTFVDRIKKEMEKQKKENEKKNNVVVPEIEPVTDKSLKSGEKMAVSASRSEDNGGNGASRTVHFSAFSSLFFSLLSLVWFSILNSST